MLELCIDTSGGASVAVVRDGSVLSRQREDNPRRHAEDLAELIQKATLVAGIEGPLARAGWSRVLVGTGPAPYTGLRAGLVTAEVFAFAAQVPLYGVPSLDVIGRASLDLLPENTEVIAVTDARRKEVYWARYAAAGPNGLETLVEPTVESPSALAAQLRLSEAVLVGPGAHLVQQQVGGRLGPDAPADAAVLSRLVETRLAAGQPLPTEPLYLRRPDIN